MTRATKPSNVLLAASSRAAALPIWLVSTQSLDDVLRTLSAEQRTWLKATGFEPAAGSLALLPDAAGQLAGAIAGYDGEATPMQAHPALGLGALPNKLPAGGFYFANAPDAAELGSVAWGLGAYRFMRYHAGGARKPRTLRLPENVDRSAVLSAVEAIWLARDLINTPANDMGPDELETAARDLASLHKADISTIVGDDLLEKNYPMIHAVGRASTRAPRLVDLSWGPKNAAKVTIVGKGICFDTGGLDIKPASGMVLMKKDMGGAAAALALAHMIMAQRLKVRLRVLLAVAENSISGNAFRPGDILASRAGLNVEIGNTDAEGRLVLADALASADEDKPQHIMSFATLTGAARVALGPDLPPFYTDDDDLAAEITKTGLRVGDPVWRMPFWGPYDADLASDISDVNHISQTPFAGSITAALFLKRFVNAAAHYTHFDIYGWMPRAKAHAPKGGEAQAARTMFEVLSARYAR